MEELLKDPVFFRGIERWLIALGGIMLCVLGYKLFIHGLKKGRGKLITESKLLKVTLSGSGPGLFFMAFGSIILITAILTRIEFKAVNRHIDIVQEEEGSFTDIASDTLGNIVEVLIPKKNPTKYPYDGMLENNRYDEALMSEVPLIFKNKVNFKNSNFYNTANFTGSRFETKVDFSKTTFYQQANFEYAHFNDSTIFDSTEFHSIANFKEAIFNGNIKLRIVKFDSIANFNRTQFNTPNEIISLFPGTQFISSAFFGGAQFEKDVYFYYTKFYGLADFQDAEFKGNFNFRDGYSRPANNTDLSLYYSFSNLNFKQARFYKKTEFRNVQFRDSVNFDYAEFNDQVRIDEAQFDKPVSFRGCFFKKSIDLSFCKFDGSLDFTGANFDSVTSIVFHNISFPKGRFYCSWDQFKGSDSLRITSPSAWTKSHYYEERLWAYKSMENIYNLLRDNFIAQNDKETADAVSYELAWQREEILQEFWWKIYGWLFGWGYQPWKFLIYIMISIILGYSTLRLKIAFK